MPECIRGEMIAIIVASAFAGAMIALWLVCFIFGVWSMTRKHSFSGPCLTILTINPFLVAFIVAVLGVALWLIKLIAARRIGAIDGSDVATDGSEDDVGEHEMVEPPVQPPPVPIIPSSSSASDGGVQAGGNVASAADVQVRGESHHRTSEIEREIEMSGEASAKAVE